MVRGRISHCLRNSCVALPRLQRLHSGVRGLLCRHERLCRERTSIELWAKWMRLCKRHLCPETMIRKPDAATAMFERGPAEHHFDRPGSGKGVPTMANTIQLLLWK
jgi:hypothetical protein